MGHSQGHPRACGRSFCRLLLNELIDDRSLTPDRVVQHAIERWAFVHANRRHPVELPALLLCGGGLNPQDREHEDRDLDQDGAQTFMHAAFRK